MHILGIHLDAPFLRAALIRKGRKGIEIEALKTASLYEIEDVKRLYIEMTDAKNFNGQVVSSLSAKDFLIRSMELKIAGHRHTEEAIAFQSEATSHFNPADILTVPMLQKKEKGVTGALLFTAPREALKNHLAELENFQIDPDGVSTVPLALCHFIRWKFPHLTEAVVVDLGSSETTCALLEKGQLKKAHPIQIGVEALLSSLLEDRKRILLKKEIEGAAKQIDLLLLKPALNPHLTAALDELRKELAKVQYRFSPEKKPLIFTGRIDPFIHLREYLIDSYQDHYPMTLEEQKFAVSIGLAIEQTLPQPLQFRREEFFPRKNWTRMGFYATVLLLAASILSLLLVGLGLRFSHLRKTEMLRAISLPNSSEKVEEKIDRWISAIEKNNREYPYILQAPKVAEVMSWVSSNPLLETLKKEGDPIDLRELRYQLVSMPKIGSAKEPYLVKVEIEFQFKSAMNARRFHEALRQGDERVNPDLEITWDALSNGYRAAFFLKNRSPHVF